MTRKRRTDEEILAETKAKAERQAARIAAKNAKTNPILAPLAEAKETLNKQIAVITRGFSAGPQSFDARIAQHSLWIAEIEAARYLAEIELAENRAFRDQVSDRLELLSETISKDGHVTQEMVDEALTYQPTPLLQNAREAYAAAQRARKDSKAKEMEEGA